jgi:hypothetical protein
MPLLIESYLSDEEMQGLLTDLGRRLPARATSYEVAMIVAFVCHRYGMPPSVGVHVFAHALDFLAEHNDGPRSKRDIH